MGTHPPSRRETSVVSVHSSRCELYPWLMPHPQPAERFICWAGFPLQIAADERGLSWSVLVNDASRVACDTDDLPSGLRSPSARCTSVGRNIGYIPQLVRKRPSTLFDGIQCMRLKPLVGVDSGSFECCECWRRGHYLLQSLVHFVGFNSHLSLT